LQISIYQHLNHYPLPFLSTMSTAQVKHEGPDDTTTIKTKFVNIGDESIIVIYQMHKRECNEISIYVVSTTKKLLTYHGTPDAIMNHPENSLIEPNGARIRDLLHETMPANSIKELYLNQRLKFGQMVDDSHIHIPFVESKNIDTIRLNRIAKGLADDLKIEIARINENKRIQQQEQIHTRQVFQYQIILILGIFVIFVDFIAWIVMYDATIAYAKLGQQSCNQIEKYMTDIYRSGCVAIVISSTLAAVPFLFSMFTNNKIFATPM